MTELSIKNIFYVSSLPQAIVLRKDIFDNADFKKNYETRLLYVALIDSMADDYPAEFGYNFRDWI